LSPGDVAEVTVWWAARANVPFDYSVFVHLVDTDGLTLAQLDTVPGGGLRPTSQWQPGEEYIESYRVQIPPTAYTPNQATWAVGLYGGLSRLHSGPIDGERQPVRLASDVPPSNSSDDVVYTDGTALRFGNVTVEPPPDALPNALDVQFEDGIRLVGYSLSRRVLRPGDTLDVTLYWQTNRALNQEYTVYVHLLDEALDGRGGYDAQPVPPTTEWLSGESYPALHPLPIPADLPPGLYRLAVGMYTQPGFVRLGVQNPEQAEGADRYLLGPVRVE
jgi:hypothetical protein